MIVRRRSCLIFDGVFKLILSCIIFIIGSTANADVDATRNSSVDGVSQQVVLRLLKGYEWKLNEREFLKTGSGVSARLLEIAQDPNQPNFIQARAAAALTLFPTPEVASYYVAELDGKKDRGARADASARSPAERVRRSQIAQNYCSTFVASEPQRVESTLLPLLVESNAHLRVQSARCLAQIDSDDSRKALVRYRDSIDDLWERQAAGFGEKEVQ